MIGAYLLVAAGYAAGIFWGRYWDDVRPSHSHSRSEYLQAHGLLLVTCVAAGMVWPLVLLWDGANAAHAVAKRWKQL